MRECDVRVGSIGGGSGSDHSDEPRREGGPLAACRALAREADAIDDVVPMVRHILQIQDGAEEGEQQQQQHYQHQQPPPHEQHRRLRNQNYNSESLFPSNGTEGVESDLVHQSSASSSFLSSQPPLPWTTAGKLADLLDSLQSDDPSVAPPRLRQALYASERAFTAAPPQPPPHPPPPDRRCHRRHRPTPPHHHEHNPPPLAVTQRYESSSDSGFNDVSSSGYDSSGSSDDQHQHQHQHQHYYDPAGSDDDVALGAALHQLRRRLEKARVAAFQCGILLERRCRREARMLRRRELVDASAAAGPRALMELLIRYPADVVLQERGWRAVGDLLSGDSDAGGAGGGGGGGRGGAGPPPSRSGAVAEKFGRFGACELVVPTMQRFGAMLASSARSANVATTKTTTMSSSSSAPLYHGLLERDEKSARSGDFFDDGGAAEHDEYGDEGGDESDSDASDKDDEGGAQNLDAVSIALQGWCCRAIYLIAWDNEANHERLGGAGACEAVVMTLRNYGDDLDIQGYGCLAVAYLAWYPPNRDRLLRIGGAATLEQAALRFTPQSDDGGGSGGVGGASPFPMIDAAAHASIAAVISKAQAQLGSGEEAGYCSVQ